MNGARIYCLRCVLYSHAHDIVPYRLAYVPLIRGPIYRLPGCNLSVVWNNNEYFLSTRMQRSRAVRRPRRRAPARAAHLNTDTRTQRPASGWRRASVRCIIITNATFHQMHSFVFASFFLYGPISFASHAGIALLCSCPLSYSCETDAGALAVVMQMGRPGRATHLTNTYTYDATRAPCAQERANSFFVCVYGVGGSLLTTTTTTTGAAE